MNHLAKGGERGKGVGRKGEVKGGREGRGRKKKER